MTLLMVDETKPKTLEQNSGISRLNGRDQQSGWGVQGGGGCWLKGGGVRESAVGKNRYVK